MPQSRYSQNSFSTSVIAHHLLSPSRDDSRRALFVHVLRVQKTHVHGGAMKKDQLNELLYQALETELGGVQIYTVALRCAVNDDLKEEWKKYLDQTKNHVQIVQDTMELLGLDTDVETPGRLVVRHIGESLVKAMEMALESGEKGAAQLVASESVTLAETKDHLNWHLIGEAARKASGDVA